MKECENTMMSPLRENNQYNINVISRTAFSYYMGWGGADLAHMKTKGRGQSAADRQTDKQSDPHSDRGTQA